MDLSLTSLRAFISGAEQVDVVGLRPLGLRHVVLLGLMAAVSLVETHHMGLTQGQPYQTSTFQMVTHHAEERPIPPDAPYRLEVTNEKNGLVITSVLVDPEQWAPIEQSSFVRKLVRQADMRAQRDQLVLSLVAYASDGQIQAQAIRFVAGTIRETGVETLPEQGSFGVGVGPNRPAGVRFTPTPSTLDALGSDPCLVATGDLVACMVQEQTTAESDVSPKAHISTTPQRASLGQTLAGADVAAVEPRPRSRGPR